MSTNVSRSTENRLSLFGQFRAVRRIEMKKRLPTIKELYSLIDFSGEDVSIESTSASRLP